MADKTLEERMADLETQVRNMENYITRGQHKWPHVFPEPTRYNPGPVKSRQDWCEIPDCELGGGKHTRHEVVVA